MKEQLNAEEVLSLFQAASEETRTEVITFLRRFSEYQAQQIESDPVQPDTA